MTTPQAPPPDDGAQRGRGQGQGQGQGQAGHDQAGDPEERTPGLAEERTSLAWTRTAIAFAALGGIMLKANVVTGLIIVAVAPVIWQLGRVTRGGAPAGDRLSAAPMAGATRLFIITVTIAAVALVCLIVAIFGKSVPGALR